MSFAIQENLQRHQFQMMTMSSIVNKIQQLQVVIQNQQNVIDKINNKSEQKEVIKKEDKLKTPEEKIQINNNNNKELGETLSLKKIKIIEKDIEMLNIKLERIEDKILKIKLPSSNVSNNYNKNKTMIYNKLEGFADPENKL